MYSPVDYIYENISCLLAAYFIVQMFAYFIVEKKFKYIRPRSGSNLHILDAHDNNVFSFVSLVMEYFILNRYSFFGYKNMIKNNLRIFASFFLAIFVFLIITFIYKILAGWSGVCMNVSLKEICSALIGFTIASFVIERKMVYEKWMYLANLYNKIVEIEMKANETKTNPAEFVHADLMRAGLIIDILDMEMWSHPSFSGFFKSELENETNTNEESIDKKVLRSRISNWLESLT